MGHQKNDAQRSLRGLSLCVWCPSARVRTLPCSGTAREVASVTHVTREAVNVTPDDIWGIK